MKALLSALALAGAATVLPVTAAEAAPLSSLAKVEHPAASLAEPVWWRHHHRRGGWGLYGYPAYGYYGCCYGGWGWRHRHHHRRWW